MNCRILYVVGQLGCGGLERQLFYLFQMLDRERYRPELVVWSSSETEVYNSAIETLGIPIHRFPAAASRVQKLFAFRRLVRNLKPEVVHSYSFHTNFAAWWAAIGTPALPVGAVRSDFLEIRRDTGALLGRLCARWPRGQIFNSQAAAESARQTPGFFVPSASPVVRNGVDLQRFSNVPLPAERFPRIVGVGSLFAVKRWDRLLRAVCRMREMGLDFEVRIVGDGPLRGELQQQIHASGLCDRVELLGYRSDVAELLASASFLAHTSDSEGCPNVVAEAMACGKAVVSTNSGDVTSLVEDGVTGFVVPCPDEETLAERMATLTAAPDLCNRMGQAGRAKVERELSLERLVRDTLNAYKKMGWAGLD